MKVRTRRLIVALLIAVASAGSVTAGYVAQRSSEDVTQQGAIQSIHASGPAADALVTLPVKGRAPKTGYTRAQFSVGWQDLGSCDVRNYILGRDMTDVTRVSVTDCTVLRGTLHDPYTAKIIQFVRGPESSKVQIDHVVALSDAWQKGAQQLTAEQRYQLANDPLELLAVDGQANTQKSDADAATWLPPNKAYRCAYVARQIAVKQKYQLWVTTAEHDAMQRVLSSCPSQLLPVVAP